MNIASLFSKVISSYKTSIILMLLFSLALGVATFVEKFNGTEVAKLFFYYSPLMFLIQFLLVVNFLAVSSRYQLINKKKISFVIIHFAFIIILAGAFVTHLFGVEGSIHLRENMKTNHMLVQTNRGNHQHHLPFSIELEKFTLTRYPGSSSPSSFESIVKIEDGNEINTASISMNNVLDVKGYRLFQASYDTDEKGTILSVNKDVAGRTITYFGYFLLVVGFFLSIIGKHSRFCSLISELKDIKGAKFILFITLALSPTFTLQASPTISLYEVLQTHQIPQEHAAKFGALPMQATNGRMKPINTFSSEVLRKLHHADKIGDLTSDQFLLSLLTFPQMWQQVKFIYYKNSDIARLYGLSEKYCSYSELFDSKGHYKLQKDVDLAHAKSPAQRTRLEKDIIKLDEQINILHQLIKFQLVRIFPKKDDPNHKWYASGDKLSSFSTKDSTYITNLTPQYISSIQSSMKTGDWTSPSKILDVIKSDQKINNTTLDINENKIEAELLFNQLDAFRYCKIAYLILGGLLIFLLFLSSIKKYRWQKFLINSSIFFICTALLFHIFGLALRGYIGGYAPWSNSYETMIYISLIAIIVGIVFVKQSKITFALSTLFAGIILFVAGLNWMDPQINTLVPVLKSPWLMIHVAVIVAAYSFFGIACLLGITNLILLLSKHRFAIKIKELSIINEMSLLIGLALMTIGTFLGAIWANESWGRYWGWDSKETWALITILIYACVTHLRLVKKWNNPLLFNLVSVLAFLSVLMTYFGVNYFLTGLHSYA